MPEDYGEDDYRDMIDAALNGPAEGNPWPTYALDLVASPGEWKAFKAAMARWLVEQDAAHTDAFDSAALEQEHDDDG